MAGLRTAVIGGGIAGLALALNLHRRGMDCRVYEAVADLREIGVGITQLPHAVRELAALGLQAEVEAAGIETRSSAFFNRFGQLLYKEARGRFAGYPVPEIGIHRGRLHAILLRAVRERLGEDAVETGRRCVGVEAEGDRVRVRFEGGAGAEADVAVACDGVNSAVRRQFYPDDAVVFTGINTWRGITRRAPILDGRTYMRIGAITTGKMVIYPIADEPDGRQLINWVAELQGDARERNDWNRAGRAEDVLPLFAGWVFDWLDATALIRDAEAIFEYPMVDKDPIERWSFRRVTLAGDAAHPMYPRGSNGSAQALIDVRVLADALAEGGDPEAALKRYEAVRAPQTAQVVRTNRTAPPDAINLAVEERLGDRPYEDLESVITQAELRAISDRYKQVSGFSLGDLGAQPGGGGA